MRSSVHDPGFARGVGAYRSVHTDRPHILVLRSVCSDRATSHLRISHTSLELASWGHTYLLMLGFITAETVNCKCHPRQQSRHGELRDSLVSLASRLG